MVLTYSAIGHMEEMSVTSELSIRYLRPAVGHRLFARAQLESRSRRSFAGTVALWCDEEQTRKVSVGQGTYALPLD